MRSGALRREVSGVPSASFTRRSRVVYGVAYGVACASAACFAYTKHNAVIRVFAIGVIYSKQGFQIPHTATSFNRRHPLWRDGHKQAWAGAAAGTRGCRSHDAENRRPDCLRAEPTAANAMPVPDHVGLYHPENR